jgi:hypothetical protein
MQCAGLSGSLDEPPCNNGSDRNGAKGYRSCIKEPMATENTEYLPIISVSSVDSVAIYHDFDLRKYHSAQSS